MTGLQIEREESDKGGRYVARLDGAEAEMTWTASDSIDIIDHTFVPPELRGQSVGQALVARAVEDARANGRRLLPLCSFAAAQFRRHPEWHDILPH
ncbi:MULTISPECIES: GNAT family N-acetyltransferase [unclassified Paracoccus (in: a-proteobacteria)]|uniref:GNAT family N-acetyltransferase n=1 Tax=unclassified Paracoccus (in: a-proteobacteria) TaxID=2688777 RepID=UPI0016011E34|nr:MULTISPECIES: GNAT family N-acetyltransferase [unclassified Paracoccus (in: a-proteobacteria)]MBB1491832.1 N-acetyltransferase [Paracoccus sp. MC1854]MBB1496928.1 N-acetyltransferase [Paracoccus sp. MC1862]QQO45549.1 N-acetyltransferase [Paracoccus sp. MC1862]